MGILRVITQFLNQIVYFISSPFRALGITDLTMPFRTAYNSLSYVVRSLGASVGGVGFSIPGIKDVKETFDDWRAAREYEALEQEHAFLLEKGDYSQIHITHDGTDERHVVHIGTSIGRSANEVVLKRPTHPPVRLRFTQVNKQRYGAPILMEYMEGTSKLLVDATVVKELAPISHGSVIQVDEESYNAELFAWDKLPPMARLNAGWVTSAGPVRPYNEDAVGIYQHPRGYFFAVADGVGGGEAGETISEFAVQFMLATFHANIRYDMDWNEVYRQALDNINNAVRRFARQSDFPTAGSTFTGVVIKGWDAYICHVGDSRLYLYNARELRQITTDHMSIIEEPDGGSRRRPQRRTVLEKAIGKADSIDPELRVLRLQPGDKLLLSSDGLNERLKPAELTKMLEDLTPARLPQRLVDMANERYNSDNISIIVLDVTAKAGFKDGWKATTGDRVYAGYDPRWTLRLKPIQRAYTRYEGARQGWFGRALIFLLVLVLAGLTGVFLNQEVVSKVNADLTAAVDATQLILHPVTATATATLTPTNTPRPLPSSTPTATPSITPTPLPTEAPTSTIDPGPTSTLALRP